MDAGIARRRKRKAKKKAACKTVKKRKGGKVVKKKVCAKRKPVKKPAKRKPKAKAPLKPAPAARPAPVQPVPPAPVPARVPKPPATPGPAPAAGPAPTAGPAPKPPTGAGGSLSSPVARYTGPFGVRQAERLLWRAGCGPSPGHAEALARMGLDGAILALTRPVGTATLTGAEPTDGRRALEPRDAWGHDHLWFLDRMVRTSQPLIERMTLIWHDWFATSRTVVEQPLMIDQNELFRARALGSFHELVKAVTVDPAMIVWLDQDRNRKGQPNENYARELMELFTLGADRDAYTETDVRELARCLTGWTSDWSPEQGHHNFRYAGYRHDDGAKTVFGRSGNFGWEDAVRMCVEHDKHASFFVQKLWSYFIPTPPSASDVNALAALYVRSGREVRPVLEAILAHPALYTGPRMVKPPAVYVAGMLRVQRRAVDRSDWVWLGEGAGQRLFEPPNVAGWDDQKWLDTSTLRARWLTVAVLLNGHEIKGTESQGYSNTETPAQAVAKARAFWNDPELTSAGSAHLDAYASSCLPPVMASWQQRQYRAARQNALRLLLAVSPDLQTC